MLERISIKVLVLVTVGLAAVLPAQSPNVFIPFIADVKNPAFAAFGLTGPPMRLYVSPGVLREDVPAPPSDPDAKKDFTVVLRLYESGRSYLMQPAIHGCVVQNMPANEVAKASGLRTLKEFLPQASDWTPSATVKVTQLGKERVSGVMCRVLEVQQPSPKVSRVKVWVASGVNLPVKVEITDSKGQIRREVLIQHLAIGPISSGLLQPPKRCQFVPGWNNGVQIRPGTME